jgi:TP901 family phage tail tape measure protein
MELIIAARDRTGAAFNKVKSKMAKLGFTSDKVTAALKGAAKAGALIGGAAVVAGIVGSTKAFMDFEDAMANVRKTTGFTKEQITVLGELASIAATAGQLGITGQKNILSFTETVAKMTTAFDMSADSVAIAAAKLTNIYNIPIEQVGNLGSAINVLGNTTAASESQLMAFSMSLGPTGQQLGFTATEALSLGASMVSIGMDASAAGTRLNRAFSMIGQNLDELASFMGVTTEEFTASFEEMPMETFMGVLEKLSRVEGKLKANTVASQLFNEIGAKAIKGLTGDLDGLRTNLKNSADGFKANTSLSEEFAAKTDTLKARFQLLKNSITSLLIDIGGELAPTLNSIIEGFRNILPAVKDLVFEIGAGFGEMFESITRQAGGTLDPLIKKLKEAGDKISSGLNFKTLLDDIGVFIGAGLNPLIRGFTWLIDKLGPLWELIGKGTTLFHNLANAVKTEEGRIDDIVDATDKLTKAKQELFDINEKLRGNVETLADALEKAGGWTTTLVDLEADAKTKTEALAVARLKASEAITVHGANSEIAKTAIENVKIAEEAATGATNDFNTAVSTAAGVLIDEGVATGGLEKAQLDFIETTEDVIDGQKNLETAVIDVETELEEAKAAPFKLGEAFTDFGKLVARTFLAIPLKIAEAILSVQEIISGGLEKIGLGGFKKKLDADTEHIKKKIASIRKSLITNIEEPLLEDMPDASKKMEEAVTASLNAIATPAKRTKKGIDEVTDALEEKKPRKRYLI